MSSTKTNLSAAIVIILGFFSVLMIAAATWSALAGEPGVAGLFAAAAYASGWFGGWILADSYRGRIR